jgi:hypothetical protein
MLSAQVVDLESATPRGIFFCSLSISRPTIGCFSIEAGIPPLSFGKESMIRNFDYQTKTLSRVSRWASLPFIAKLFLAATLLSYAPAMRAASSPYDYQVFAKTGDVIGDITLESFSSAFLSDDGSVVFVGRYNSCCEALVFKRSAASKGQILIRQGDLVDGQSISSFQSVKRNDRGEIVFSATIGEGSSVGIFRLTSAVALPGETLGGITLTNLFGDFDLNDRREIVYDGFSGSPANDAVYGIFTPSRVIVRSGDVIDGLTLQVPGEPTLSKNGLVVFTSTFEDSAGQMGIGVFTQHRLVVKVGDTLDGLPLLGLGEAIISERGLIGIAFDYSNAPIGQAFAVGGKIAVKSGDVIDGFTIVGQPDGIPFPATLNANGEVLFTTGATSPGGVTEFALFTPHHLVAAPGDTIDGLTAQGGVGLSSINDAGQIAFLIFLDRGASQAALIVATPNVR